MAWRSTSLSSPIGPNLVRSSSGCGAGDCGRTSATSRPSTMPSPPSSRPSDARGRRSSAFVRERHAPIDACGRSALSRSAGCVLTLLADECGRQKLESDIRDNPAMGRFEMPLGDRALAVAYYNVEDGRVVLLHTEVPQELSRQGYGSRLAHDVFEALRRDGRRVIAKCPSCLPTRRGTASTAYSSMADRRPRGMHAHNTF